MPSGSIAIVVGASAEKFDHVKQCLSNWQCVTAPLNDEETEVSSMPAATEVIMVYARKNPKNTPAICEQLRNSPECSGAPMLLVINRYEISQGSGIRKATKAVYFRFSYYSLLKRAVLLYSQSKFRCLALCEALES